MLKNIKKITAKCNNKLFHLCFISLTLYNITGYLSGSGKIIHLSEYFPHIHLVDDTRPLTIEECTEPSTEELSSTYYTYVLKQIFEDHALYVYKPNQGGKDGSLSHAHHLD